MSSPTGRWVSEGSVGSLALALLAGGGVVAAETTICSFLLADRLTDVVMVYLLGVVVVAMRFGYVPSLFTAAASVAAFDFFFTVPHFSFAVTDRRDVLTFVIMFFVAFVISNRTERIRRIASAARERETRTAKLYAMSRELAVAPSSDDIVPVAYRPLHDVFHSEVSVLLPDAAGALARAGTMAPEIEIGPELASAAAQVFAAWATAAGEHRALDGAQVISLQSSSGAVGVLIARPRDPAYFASPAHAELLDTFGSQIALALERARLGEQAQ